MLRKLPMRAITLGIVLIAFTASAAWAQEEDTPTGYSAIIDNIDLLVDNYARFLGRKYDLNEEQDAYTKQLLREKAYDFLDSHEGELRGLVDRMFDVRTGGDISPEELIEWGQKIRPIYDEAKDVIIKGNDDFRDILTEEQRAIHDEDMKLMYESFATTEDQLDRISAGEMTVEEFRNPGRHANRKPKSPRRQTAPPDVQSAQELSKQEPQPHNGTVRNANGRVSRPVPPKPRNADVPPPEEDMAPAGPETPPTKVRNSPGRERPHSDPGKQPRTSRGRTTRPGKASSKTDFESEWDRYVKEFIEKYELNDEQTQKANSVLEDCKSQANGYLASRKAKIELIDKQLAELRTSKDKNKAAQTKKLSEQRQEMLAPIDQIFEKQLKPRLDRLPTRAQRKAGDEKAAKGKRGGAKKPASKTSEKGKSGKDKD